MKRLLYIAILMITCYACQTKPKLISEQLIQEQEMIQNQLMTDFFYEFQMEYNRVKEQGNEKFVEIIQLMLQYNDDYLILLEKIDKKQDLTSAYNQYHKTVATLEEKIKIMMTPHNGVYEPIFYNNFDQEEEQELLQEINKNKNNSFKTYLFKNMLLSHTINIVGNGCHVSGIADCLCSNDLFAKTNAYEYQEGDTVFIQKIMHENHHPINLRVSVRICFGICDNL
ncbi:MAG: hypothetical protein GY828_07260 [Candidatus Gracilibacteria bacterium]|nr:hypothetical protein [Candidatus Gracilibacteria bacterium]